MIARRILVLAMIAGASGMACTAIVLGSISDYDGYTRNDFPSSSSSSSSSSSGNSSSSSSGTGDEACSLLKRYSYSQPFPANDCSNCIANECMREVGDACGDGKDKKPWFQDLADCAQNPWVEFPKPNSSGSTWQCGQYDTDAGPIPGSTDQAVQRQSELCVRDSCLKGPGAPCRLCEVNIKGTGADSTQYLLREDPCGKLFTEHCNQTIINCCRSIALDQYIEYCSNTVDAENLAKCKGILDAKKDPEAFKAAHPGGWGSTDFQCAADLANCFDAHSASYKCN